MKTSWRRLEDVLKTFLSDVLKTFWKCLENVLKMYGQDENRPRRLKDVFWRRMTKANLYVLKTSSEDEDERRLQDVFKMSSSRWMFARKEVFAQNRRDAWSLSDCNGIRTHDDLVLIRTVKWTIQTSTHNTAQSFRPVWLNGSAVVYELGDCRTKLLRHDRKSIFQRKNLCPSKSILSSNFSPFHNKTKQDSTLI